MYSYGPFDSDVLADLSSAETLAVVDVSPVEFVGGYGYRIRSGARAGWAKKNADQFLTKHKKDIDWLFSTFEGLNSAELELASTIVYVDREFSDCHQRGSVADVATRVQDIKPHFSREQVRGAVEDLLRKGVLASITIPISKMA